MIITSEASETHICFLHGHTFVCTQTCIKVTQYCIVIFIMAFAHKHNARGRQHTGRNLERQAY